MNSNQSPEEQDQELTNAQVGHLPGHAGHARAGQNYEHKHESKSEAKTSKWGARRQRLKEFTKECRRVLKVTKKPNMQEFKTIVKISGLGIVIIGLMGFLIFFAREGLKRLF
jgi:protein transport protein SEC61 subunit gamma-like protein